MEPYIASIIKGAIMKRFLHLSCLVFMLAVYSHASESLGFGDLQLLTNTIAEASSMNVWCSGINGLPAYLEILTESEIGKNFSQKDISYAKSYTNVYRIAKMLDDEDPATSIPRLFALLENDSLSDLKETFYENRITNTYGEWIYQRIDRKLNIKLPIDKQSVFLQWMPQKTLLLRPKTLTFFWYYCGLKYLPILFEDWYMCWKLENSREKPREEILDKLAGEVSRFNYHVFPFLVEKIENGDSTLFSVVKKIRRDGGYRCLTLFGTPDFENRQINSKLKDEYTVDGKNDFDSEEDFLTFWNENKARFLIKRPEKKLSEIKHIFARKCRPNEMSPAVFCSAIEAEKALDYYCSLKERPISNCWYFSLKDDNENN